SGAVLKEVVLHYATYGKLNQKRDNAVLVCHALSGSARIADWWPEIVKIFDPKDHFVIGINLLGSCYGSTGPRSIDPDTGSIYGDSFPVVTILDSVRAQKILLDHLGVELLQAVVGGSIGGMQALQWAVEYPEKVSKCAAIAATPLSAMGLALNHLQRLAIFQDSDWNGGRYSQQPEQGLTLARAIATCSYKSADLFQQRHARLSNRNGDSPYTALKGRFDIAGYLDYQGSSFIKRFDAASYVSITKTMDTFDFEKIYGSEKEAFQRIKAEILLVGVSSDWLFPAKDVKALTTKLKEYGVDARYCEIESSHGHDAFLADFHLLIPALAEFFEYKSNLLCSQSMPC
ncbi:MAG: homoserine O-acetyltransferase, partial [Blastocatellia bacterium]|nr:homoserine O-acetyltransferase [Blastocatellia bacterium]